MWRQRLLISSRAERTANNCIEKIIVGDEKYQQRSAAASKNIAMAAWHG
jgi:hypothetical protein